jgi:hypothetical protein
MNLPLTLQQAQEQYRCRICGELANVSGPDNQLILNYGKEFAHQKCLDKLEGPVKVNDEESLLNSTANPEKKTVGVGMPQALYLNEFGSLLWSVFGEVPYHVGSSLTKSAWRDVDVRIMLDKEVWEKWGFKEPRSCHQDGKWVGLCMAFSELGKKLTGLPIDFQIQMTDDANEKYARIEHQRSSLGHIDLRIRRKTSFEKEHTCEESNCYNFKAPDKTHCAEHQDKCKST